MNHVIFDFFHKFQIANSSTINGSTSSSFLKGGKIFNVLINYVVLENTTWEPDSEKPKGGTGLSRSSNLLNEKIKLADLNVEENNNGIANVNKKVPSDKNPKLNDFLLDFHTETEGISTTKQSLGISTIKSIKKSNWNSDTQ